MWKLRNKVFQNICNAAAQTGKLWALMYDLSLSEPGQLRSIFMDDYNFLKATYDFRNHGSYIRHKGKPLIVIWGVGFNDGRHYSLAECDQLVNFLKADGNSVMVGTPRYWRQGGRDAVNGADLQTLHNILRKADVVSPWSVGRYTNIASAQNDARVYVKADVQWCQQYGLTLMPVIWPGFSRHNLVLSTQGKEEPYNIIPRKQNGQYMLQVQGTQVIRAGARTIFVAMFDEMNEGTNILKCLSYTPSTPDGLKFVGYEQSPQFYLLMTGRIGKSIKLADEQDEKQGRAKVEKLQKLDYLFYRLNKY